jgi:excisionase family DNA binding protein
VSARLEDRPLAAASLRLRGLRRRVRPQVHRPNPPALAVAYTSPEEANTSAPASVSPRLLGVKDAAHYLGLSPFTIRNMVKDRRLLAVAIPGLARVLLDVHDLDALIESWKSQS